MRGAVSPATPGTPVAPAKSLIWPVDDARAKRTWAGLGSPWASPNLCGAPGKLEGPGGCRRIPKRAKQSTHSPGLSVARQALLAPATPATPTTRMAHLHPATPVTPRAPAHAAPVAAVHPATPVTPGHPATPVTPAPAPLEDPAWHKGSRVWGKAQGSRVCNASSWQWLR